jgi:hypothetical protein
VRRRMLAIALALMAITTLAPSAGAESDVDDYICVRSRLLLGDPVCIKWYPGA